MLGLYSCHVSLTHSKAVQFYMYCVPGPVLLILQDHHRGGLLHDWAQRCHVRQRHRVPRHHQHPQTLQPIPRGTTLLSSLFCNPFVYDYDNANL